MGFLDKAKAAAGQAASKAKEEYEDLQLKVELGRPTTTLGKATFELIESGELAHEKLDAPAAKIRELRERAAGSDAPEETVEGEPETLEPAAPPSTQT